MPTVGRMKNNGDLLLAGEVKERWPAVMDGLKAHFPLDGNVKRYVPARIRYIRDHLGYGSTANTSNHWITMQAFDENGINVALNKPAVNSVGGTATAWTNESLDTNKWSLSGLASGTYLMVDLGDLYNIQLIKHWHYYGDKRKYYKTRVSVSEDGVKWFDVFDSEIEGEYNESATGHVIDLVNPGTTLIPIINTNTSLTDNDIAIEEATTNLWTGGLSVYNNYKAVASISTLNETYKGQPIYRLAMKPGDDITTTISHFQTSLSGHGVVGGALSWTEDTKFVSSIYWRPVNKADVVVGGTASNASGWSAGKTEYLEDGWRRFYRYRTGVGIVAKTDSIHHSFYCPSLELNETIYIDFSCPQTEMGKTYPTSYVASSRGAGRLDIPFTLKPPYSINFWHTPMKPLREVTEQANSPMILQMGNYYTNASISMWNYSKSFVVYMKGNAATGWTATKNFQTYSESTWDYKEHMYTLVAVDNRTFRIYIDGVYKGEMTNSEDVTNISFLSIGNAYMPNAKYRNFSVYNKALSAEEAKTLFGKILGPNKYGDLLTRKFVESSDGLLTGVKYRAKSNNFQIQGSVYEGQTL